MGAIDRLGRAVSFIQSLYWEFGSGVVSPSTGVLWQNRGHSFSLDDRHPNRLEPGRLPFHTLNPALAFFDDGRTLVYGTMGGDGQPQTQAALFARYAWANYELQEAIAAPRWLLGRTWGAHNASLKLENRFPAELFDRLRACGHVVEPIGPFDDLVGHAGAVVRHPDGLLEGAADPRSDGSAVGI
jgi:gamma-glutamyltranspeptidase/glutathione hydrolase